MTGFAPVLLLDEIIAHLDPSRRNALYDTLFRLGSQIWMTGADPVTFAEIAPRAQIFEIVSGKIYRRSV
jgi:DNA replication and repair protein RecF